MAEKMPWEDFAPQTGMLTGDPAQAGGGAVAPGMAAPVTPEPVTPDVSSPWEDFAPKPETLSMLEEAEAGTINLLSGTNKVIAETIGMPMDAANVIVNAVGSVVGYEGPEDAVGGSESIKDLFRYMNIGTEPEEGSLSGRVGEEIGYALAPQALGLRAATVGRKMAGPVSKYFKPVVDYIGSAPIKSSLAALGIAIPSGLTAGFTGEAFEESLGEGWRPTGDILGSIGGGIMPSAAIGAGRMAGEKIKGLFPLTQESKVTQATEFVQQHMRPESIDVLRGEADLALPQFGRPTTGEALDDPGLISLQRALERRGEGRGVSKGYTIREEQQASLQEGLAPLGREIPAPAKAKVIDMFTRRTQAAVKSIEDNLTSAMNKAEAAVAKLGPDASPQEASKVARGHLDKAYKAARTDEKKLWTGIGTGKFDTSAVREAATKIVLESPTFDDIPPLILKLARIDDELFKHLPMELQNKLSASKETLGQVWLRDKDTIANVLSVRTTAREEVAQLRQEGKGAAARKLSDTLDTLLDDVVPIGRWADKKQDAINAARKFSFSLNETFTRGPIGEILGSTRMGLRVSPERTLNAVLSPSKGTEGYAALLKSVEGIPDGPKKVEAAVKNFLTAKFAAASISPTTGEFKPNSVDPFLKVNREIIEQFPSLRAEMIDAKNAETLARSVEKSTRNELKRVTTAEIAARYTNGEPPMQIKAALDGKQPLTDIKKLIALANKDKTGDALQGLKGSFYETMMSRIAPDVRADLGAEQLPLIKAQHLRRFLGENRAVMRELYGNDGVRFIEEVSKGATMAANAAKGMAVGGGSDTTQSAKTLGRLKEAAGNVGVLIGTRVGAWFGMHPLLMAGKGRRMGEKMMEERVMFSDDIFSIIEDIVYSPEAARAAAKRMTTLSKKDFMTLNRFIATSTGMHEIPVAAKAGIEGIQAGIDYEWDAEKGNIRPAASP